MNKYILLTGVALDGVWRRGVKIVAFGTYAGNMFPLSRTDFWELRSAEESHLKNPEDFWIPPLAERQNVKRGQAVRLIFDIEVENQHGELKIGGERMWVLVKESIRRQFHWCLDNQSACSNFEDSVYLCFGAEVPFRAEHIVDIDTPPRDYIEWQLGLPVEQVWPRE